MSSTSAYNDHSVRRNALRMGRPDLDISLAISTVWTITSAINLSCTSTESLFHPEHDSHDYSRDDRRAKLAFEPFIRKRARNSIYNPIESLLELFDVWSSEIGTWALRAKYMEECTLPHLGNAYDRLGSHCAVPSISTVAEFREALYRNGHVDQTYINTFKNWAMLLNGSYNNDGNEDDKDYLRPELRALARLLQSICDEHRQQQILPEPRSGQSSLINPSPQSESTAGSSSNAGHHGKQGTGSLSSSNKYIISDDEISHKKDNKRNHTDCRSPHSTTPFIDLTASPPPFIESQPQSHPLKTKTLPAHYRLRACDLHVYTKALQLTHLAIRRLDSLIVDVEGYSALAEDMAMEYDVWETRVAKWTRIKEKERRERGARDVEMRDIGGFMR